MADSSDTAKRAAAKLSVEIEQLRAENVALKARGTQRRGDLVVYLVVVLLIGLLFGTMAYRALSDAANDDNRAVLLVPADDALTDADRAILTQAADILARAEASQSAAERVLNFLEGASILIGGALAVAAIYGFRNAQESRAELERETARLRDLQADRERRIDALLEREINRLTALSSELKADMTRRVTTLRDEQSAAQTKIDTLLERNSETLAEASQYAYALKQLPAQLNKLALQQQEFDDAHGKIEQLEALSRTLEQRVEDVMFAFSDLVQANQELQLRNYEEAYADVLRVLERMPQNALALYIAGWIEFQYMPDRFEDGLARMEQAYRFAPDNPTIKAAYGVVLRRKAVQSSGTLRDQLFSRAEALLLDALDANPRLLDLNHESFWGPVAGLRRDQGRLEKAIEAYESAVKVTPGSSYPHGNLAALYLCQHRALGDAESRERALHHFEKALHYAQYEMAMLPQDYFHMMDIAMSSAVLGYRDSSHLIAAHDMLNDVLGLPRTVEMLQTSRRGWYFLYRATPDDWTEVRRSLKEAIDKIDAAIVAQGEQPIPINLTLPCGNAS